jgi:hypothetical protein
MLLRQAVVRKAGMVANAWELPFRDSERRPIWLKQNVKAIAGVVMVLFVCSVWICAQESQNSAAQSVSGARAQSNNITDRDIELLREDLRAQRKQITAQNMTLTPDEATRFWPIFDQYRKEAIKPNDDRWALIKDYAAKRTTTP